MMLAGFTPSLDQYDRRVEGLSQYGKTRRGTTDRD